MDLEDMRIHWREMEQSTAYERGLREGEVNGLKRALNLCRAVADQVKSSPLETVCAGIEVVTEKAVRSLLPPEPSNSEGDGRE